MAIFKSTNPKVRKKLAAQFSEPDKLQSNSQKETEEWQDGQWQGISQSLPRHYISVRLMLILSKQIGFVAKRGLLHTQKYCALSTRFN